MSHKRGNVFIYLKPRELLKAMGLCLVDHYIGERREMVAKWIIHRLIFDMCQGVERQCGSAPCQFEWEQYLELRLSGAKGKGRRTQ